MLPGRAATQRYVGLLNAKYCRGVTTSFCTIWPHVKTHASQLGQHLCTGREAALLPWLRAVVGRLAV